MLIESLAQKTRLAMMTVFAVIGGCTVICAFTVWCCISLVNEERQQIYVLDGAFRNFLMPQNLGIPSAFSDFTLVFSPFGPQSQMHIKRFIPAMKLNELYQREKNWNFKIQVLCEQEEWVSNNL